jgi:phosphoglycolate phosphatase-like HAD superfamily hydrolase
MKDINPKESLKGGIKAVLFDKDGTLCNENGELLSNISNVFLELKQKNISIGISSLAKKNEIDSFLLANHLSEHVVFINGKDSKFYKPSKEVVSLFASKCKISSNEVVVIGDTKTDIRLAVAGNAAFSVGVLSGLSCQVELKEANYVINSVDDLLQLLIE